MTLKYHPQSEIRDTTLDDVFKLRVMHGASWRDTYPSPENGVSEKWVEERTAGWTTTEGIERSKEHFRDVFDNPNHLHKIAIFNGDIIGMVHVFKKTKSQHLGALYVATSHHGTGLAQELMRVALDWCDLSMLIDLEVAVYNTRAKTFYRKYGFEEKPGTEQLYADTIPVITMEREGKKL